LSELNESSHHYPFKEYLLKEVERRHLNAKILPKDLSSRSMKI